MLRALLSAILVLALGGVAFLVYSHFFSPDRRTAKTPDISAGGSPPAAPAQPVSPVTQPAAPAAPAPAPNAETPAGNQPPVQPVPPAPKYRRTHVVQAGDSLSNISRKYYGTPDLYGKIAEANKLRSRDHIRVGQVLIIPDGPAAPEIETTTTDDTEHTASAPQTEDFVPQPPTLSTTRSREETAPKK
ncbi:MAG: LysM domain-containing protein [Planctomycetota bacterium]|nr:LysM domain-containing protein [Planctomycetota bacterium]